MSKARRDTEARIGLVVDRWVKRLDISWLAVTNRFTLTDGDSDDRVACLAIPDWQYRQVTLRWNVVQTAGMEDDELEKTVVHELVHALIAPLFDELPDKEQTRLAKLNELATENVARAILAAYQSA